MSPLAKEEAYGLFVDADGTRVDLDRTSCDAVRATLRVIRGGKPGQNEPDPLITTGQAADILGISRRTLTRMLDAGEIPYERHGKGHRRLRMSDVTRYRRESSARRKNALADYRRHAYENGLDDLDLIEDYLAQFQEKK